MKLELDLLSNSYDYLYNSFELYNIANEKGVHDIQRSDVKKKVKWKLAFVTMVQAVELLLKEGLFRVNPYLIFDSIDNDKILEKTVSFQQAINRIKNLNIDDDVINDEKKAFLVNCSKVRNSYIHYKVNIKSEDMKGKYCKLYCIYKELHKKLISKEIEYTDFKFKVIEKELIDYGEKWTIFRGVEMYKVDFEELRDEVKENGKYTFYATQEETKVKRIPYGDESKYLHSEIELTHYHIFEVCDECIAKIGEYHLSGCDLEVCPVCFEQVITCGCIKRNAEDELVMSID